MRQALLLLANVVHTDLNYRGGSERLAIATTLALFNMDKCGAYIIKKTKSITAGENIWRNSYSDSRKNQKNKYFAITYEIVYKK